MIVFIGNVVHIIAVIVEITIVVETSVVIGSTTVVNIIASIDRINSWSRFTCSTDISIKHAVHHHSLEVAARRSKIVVAHDAGTMGAAVDIGVAEAIDHAGCPVEQAHKAANV